MWARYQSSEITFPRPLIGRTIWERIRGGGNRLAMFRFAAVLREITDFGGRHITFNIHESGHRSLGSKTSGEDEFRCCNKKCRCSRIRCIGVGSSAGLELTGAGFLLGKIFMFGVRYMYVYVFAY